MWKEGVVGMIHNISGDALIACKGGILCQQTNYFGVMGAGIAAAIKVKLLSHDNYMSYVHVCKKLGRKILGLVQFLDTPDGTVVANCFSQDDKANVYPTGRISPSTDYKAVKACMESVRSNAEILNKSVYIPYKYGCGIAGGDWNKVQDIINDVFKDSTVDVYIVKRPQD